MLWRAKPQAARLGAKAEIVNLRQARKARNRQAAEALATANRAKFGQGKAARAAQAAEAARLTQVLDGARREPGDEG